jgi:carbamoyl-phosphate synthase small subunit
VGKPALLALADGSLFYGESIGIDGQSSGEVVFNTAMTGYQEILTDPSYARQMVTLTYPHIGNVGVNDNDEESEKVHVAGLIIRDLPLRSSNWREQMTLPEYLQKHGIVAISNIDTRRLTRILRDKGAQNACLIAGDEIDEAAALAVAKDFPGLAGMDLAKEVTTDKTYQWAQGEWQLEGDRYDQPQTDQFKVVAYDFGVKRNILRMLAQRGCDVTVVPATTPADEVLAMQPDGVFLSTGPGHPAPCDYAIQAIQQVLEKQFPVVITRQWCENCQDEIWPSWCQPPGTGSGFKAGDDYQPESWFCR